MTSNTQLRIPKILLIEDDDIDAEGVRRAFARLDATIELTRAHDGVEALEVLRSKNITQPYLVLLDINMPRMNGIEFLQTIRRSETVKRSVIFVLTTSRSEEDMLAAYNHNITGYIVKQSLNNDFTNLTTMLQAYWNIVEPPPILSTDSQ